MTDGTDEKNAWENIEETVMPEGLPAPLLWRVLVMPVQPKQVSKGGIILAQESQKAEGHLQIVGKVVAMGPVAGKSEQFKVDGIPQFDVKVGDWVIFGRYTGQRCEFKGVKLILMNDDQLIAKANGPDGFRIYT